MEQLLFDWRPQLSNKVDAFYDKDFQKIRKSQKDRVFDAIGTLGEANDRDIAKYTGLSLSVVPDRRGRLLTTKEVEVSRNDIDPETGKMTVYYRVKK